MTCNIKRELVAKIDKSTYVFYRTSIRIQTLSNCMSYIIIKCNRERGRFLNNYL